MNDQVIYLFRHGETVWNVERRYQGQQDSPLTERGVEQARRMGVWIDENIEAIETYHVACSPLGRTRDTLSHMARISGLNTMDTDFTPLLKEFDYGDWESLTREEIEAIAPDEVARRYENYWTYQVPNGENVEMLATRIRKWVASVADKPRIVAVSHGGLGRVMRGIYLGLAPEQILELDVPHGVIFRLAGGQVDRFET